MAKVFKQLGEVTGVVAVYTYDVPYGTIPLLVVNKKIDRKELQGYDVWQAGGILLTKRDIEHGRDVFALRFAHMQQHATLVSGKDMLAELSIKKKHMRHALEAMLRVTLIDLREMMVQGNFSGGKQLALTLGRVEEYVHLLISKKDIPIKSFKKATKLCQHETMPTKDIQVVYDLLLDITKHIDNL